MIISLLVATDEANGIGLDNRIPWRLSEDLKRFKRLSMCHTLIMGRKTWDSIGRPLPGRTSIVITRNTAFRPENCREEADSPCFVVHSLEEALALARSRGESEAFIIGGGEIFAQSLHLSDRIYLTEVDTNANCDVFFPDLNWNEWKAVESSFVPADEKNEHASNYKVLERKAVK